MSKIVKINDAIIFDDGSTIYDFHQQDCCEQHYLSYDGLELSDLKDLEFDLSNDDFIEKVEGYGIKLKPLNGHPIPIPGYGSNNGYYSSNLTLIIKTNDIEREIDISECQDY